MDELDEIRDQIEQAKKLDEPIESAIVWLANNHHDVYVAQRDDVLIDLLTTRKSIRSFILLLEELQRMVENGR